MLVLPRPARQRDRPRGLHVGPTTTGSQCASLSASPALPASLRLLLRGCGRQMRRRVRNGRLGISTTESCSLRLVDGTYSLLRGDMMPYYPILDGEPLVFVDRAREARHPVISTTTASD